LKTEIKPLKKKIAILISGKGTNMEAIIKDSKTINYPGIVKFVLSNNPDALGIIKAKNLGIKTFVFPVNKNHSMEIFEKRLLNLLIKEKIELICLAGFMKILSKYFLQNYNGTVLNIHPSILPSIKGLNTHQRILEKDIKTHGATVHTVTSELDSGKILGQVTINILKKDTPKNLASKLIIKEHKLYTKVIRNIITGKKTIIQEN
jgi:phosphoribosylglycinamide formyltransferase-1|tara:strand:- start:52 stop:666 length:615 start_codon:yes stop_codon:yes gene_type:complete